MSARGSRVIDCTTTVADIVAAQKKRWAEYDRKHGTNHSTNPASPMGYAGTSKTEGKNMMTKSKTTEVTAVPMKHEPQKPDLKVHAKKIGDEFEQFQMANRDAAYRGIRIGILLLDAKAKLAHGEFMPWLEKNLPHITQRNANRFMGDASLAIESKKLRGLETLLLGGGTKADLAKADKLLLEFIDGRTQAELREDLKGGKKEKSRDQQQREQYDLKRECLVGLRTSCEQILLVAADLDKPRHDTACARLLETLEKLTGCAWRPDAEAKRETIPFKEHGHVYEAVPAKS